MGQRTAKPEGAKRYNRTKMRLCTANLIHYTTLFLILQGLFRISLSFFSESTDDSSISNDKGSQKLCPDSITICQSFFQKLLTFLNKYDTIQETAKSDRNRADGEDTEMMKGILHGFMLKMLFVTD
ncbi:MAG: hypothetical protein ACI3YK_04155, partial [Eubacteriales bacterium]